MLDNFESISPTAILTSYPRTFTDIPYENEIYKWLTENCNEDVKLNKMLAPEIEARYKLTNKILIEYVVEACIMKVLITFVDTHAELRRELNGYRLTFKYSNDDDEPTALNECSNNCCNNAARFCHDFFSMDGLWEKCFPDYTKVQTYRWHEGSYPMPFNGENGRIYGADKERLHLMYRTLVSTCANTTEAVHEISTVCKDAFDKLAEYAKEFEKTHPNFKVKFVK